jgi:RNA polymerase sigma factor (sigma-70 family)
MFNRGSSLVVRSGTSSRPDLEACLRHRCKTEAELDRLSDDQLIAAIASAREAGCNDCARKALGILINRRLPDLTRRARIKVPPEDAEDVAMEVLASALRSAFDGSSVGEFVEWLKTILKRRIADYYDKQARTPDTQPLPEEHQDAEEVYGRDAAVEGDHAPRVELEDVVGRLLVRFSPAHRRVIQLAVFQRVPGKETAKVVNMEFGDRLDREMSEANVHQISKRFRDKLRAALEGDDAAEDDDANDDDE